MRLIAAMLGLMLIIGLAPSADATHYMKHREYRAKTIKLPHCGDSKVLKKISRKFAWAEHHTWGTNWTIDSLTNARLRYNNFNGPSMIAHRHCRATAWLSNGQRRTVIYRVENRMGFAGFGWNVSFCVSGLDRHRVYGANCQSLR